MYLSGNPTTTQGSWLAQERAGDRCGSGNARRLISERRRPAAGRDPRRVRVRSCAETDGRATGRIILSTARGRCPAGEPRPAPEATEATHGHSRPLAPPAGDIPHTWLRF